MLIATKRIYGPSLFLLFLSPHYVRNRSSKRKRMNSQPEKNQFGEMRVVISDLSVMIQSGKDNRSLQDLVMQGFRTFYFLQRSSSAKHIKDELGLECSVYMK
ncbi:hypothetical protein KP509_29G046800 [Ceratopteris richardii]|nr:hypothetical protein KP509_29G046800 [Ceratopteris richardii]